MPDFFRRLFDTSDFPPRWQCGNWTAGHGWLHVLSDLGVWSAYVAIPCVLGYFVLRRKDVPFRFVFVLFGAFILACGTTHLMEAALFWWPAYRLAGLVKLLTAVVSWGTVLALVQVTPKALAMRGPQALEREIAARKEAEVALDAANAELRRQLEALRAGEERFRLLVEGARDHAIFMLDPHGRVTSWNPGAERIKGYRADEIVGQHFSRFYPPEAVARGWPEEELRRAAAEGRFEDEGWRVRKDGTRYWANVVITALRDKAGALRGFSKITRDMTERREAEENARRLVEEEAARRSAEEHAAALWEERERLRVTLHSIGDGVITTDAEGRVTLLNPVAEALTGWPAGEARGVPLEQVFHIVNERTRRPVENPALRALEQGVVVGLANHTVLLTRGGGEVPIDDSAAPIRREGGASVGAVLVFRNVSGRRRAEEALTRERELLRTIVDRIPVMLTIYEPDKRLLRLNPEFERVTGWSSAEAVGLSLMEECYPDPSYRERVERFMQSCQPGWMDIRMRARDGRDVETSWANIQLTDGTRVGIGIDITERKRAEEALHRATDELRIVTESMAAPVTRCSRDLKYVWANKPYADWIGRRADQVVGRPIAEIIGPQAFDRLLPYFDRVLTGQVVRYEEQVPFRGIGLRWITAVYTPTRDSQGACDGWVAVVTDIDDRKRMEQALRDGEQRLAAELDAMTRLHTLSTRLLSADSLTAALEDILENALALCRADFGNVQLYDPEADALVIVVQRGFGPEFLEYFRNVRLDEGSACARAMETGERIVVEDVLLDPDFAPHRPVAAAAGFRAVQSTPLKTRDGRVLGMLSTHYRSPHRLPERDRRLLDLHARHAVDLIERVRFEEALKAADRRKDEFLAMLGHELRNPLAPVRNAMGVLRLRCAADPAVARVLPLMERQVAALVRLVDDLLDVSRISRGKVELRKEAVDLTALAARAAETARPALDEQGHRFEEDLPVGPVWAEADPARVEQVLGNLLGNAARYTPPGGRVRLSLAREGDEAVFRVRDTGIGIPPEDLPAVWETFRQAGRVEGRAPEGLGLGLTVVRRLVELHGGAVTVASDGRDKGSEFTVRLPALPEGAGTPPRSEAVEAPADPAGGLRVLVVDDNRDAADSLALVLQLAGHETRTAGDGPEALAAAREFRPDAAFLDIGLPGGMDGYEVARRLRQEPGLEAALLVAVTGFGTPDDVAQARAARFDHHVTKPADPNLVRRLLAERRGGPEGLSEE